MAGEAFDAVVIGGGPNGLAAAITLTQNGRSCLLVEANDTLGGACRSAALTLPGFVHDFGAAVMPFGVGSPFFSSLPLERFGLEWVHPPVPLAHPLDGEPAVVLNPDIEKTGKTFDDARDAERYARLVGRFVKAWPTLAKEVLAPAHLPLRPLLMGRFGAAAVKSVEALAAGFRTERAAALLAGIGGHSAQPLSARPTAGVALLLAVAGHAVGWPIPKGGAQAVTDALAAYFKSLGGSVRTGWRVNDLKELPPARAYLFDVTPRQLLRIAGRELTPGYVRTLEAFEYGPGVFKVDWALSAPIPWSDPTCRYGGTVHVGGTLGEIAASEKAVTNGEHPRYPFVILAQPTRFDLSRAPAGRHTAWAYCHVPNGSTFDMRERIEAQVERFAPGFRDTIIARSTLNTAQLERLDANLVGGDLNGGALTLGQLFIRPAKPLGPYRTSDRQIYLCSASTPPGGGVHGMCGHHAARAALRRVLR